MEGVNVSKRGISLVTTPFRKKVSFFFETSGYEAREVCTCIYVYRTHAIIQYCYSWGLYISALEM